MRDFQTLYDTYMETLDDILCMEADAEFGDEPDDLDDARCKLADLAQELKAGKFIVTCDADFNGRTLSQTGELTEMVGEHCYIKASIGNVEGYASTMELVD